MDAMFDEELIIQVEVQQKKKKKKMIVEALYLDLENLKQNESGKRRNMDDSHQPLLQQDSVACAFVCILYVNLWV